MVPPEANWKSTFFSLWKLKDLWQKELYKNSSNATTGEKFHMHVSARFKPKGLGQHSKQEAKEESGNKKFVLPLHQRLALIQMDRKLSSKKEAFKILVERGEWNGPCDDTSTTENRAISSQDEMEPKNVSLTGGVKLIDVKGKRAVLVDKTKGLREFKFDNIYSDDCSQQTCYESSTMPLIGEFLNGANATSIVYGQTGR